MMDIENAYSQALNRQSKVQFQQELEAFIQKLNDNSVKSTSFSLPNLKKINLFLTKDYRQEAEFEEVDWALLVEMIPLLTQLYIDCGLSLAVLDVTLDDLAWRLNYFYQQHGELGLTSEDKMWLARIYHLRIFKLAALQFEWIAPNELDQAHEKWVEEGKGMMSVHIMYGQDISRSSSLHSFDLALQFFSDYFPQRDFDLFYCQSWLLYPGLMDYLSSDSHISQFMSLFQLVDSQQQIDLPYRYIFYKDKEDINAKDIKTGLQDFAYHHPEKLGIGTGLVSRNEMREWINEEKK